MQQILATKLHAHLAEHNPDLLIRLQDKQNVTAYISAKVQSVMGLAEELLESSYPAGVVEEQCFQRLIEDLLPSRYHYLATILEEEFEQKFQELKDAGVLTYEICNLIDRCEPVFTRLGFCVENEDDRFLRCAVIGTVSQYFQQDSATIKE